jgi:DNA-binding HxlR family transcriptional regulator
VPRPGARALSVLAVPFNGAILRQLHGGPMRLAEMHRGGASIPQSTLRARLKSLEAGGLAKRRVRKGSTGITDFELTDAGTDLLMVAAALERWLCLSPNGALDLESAGGKSAITALEAGWSSAIVGTLAIEPQCLSELATSISDVSYPALDRRLRDMRHAGQVQACERDGLGTPYEVTDWLRQGVAPLAAAARWERTHFPEETAAVTRPDIEAAFLLSLPLLQMERSLAGACRLEVEIDPRDGRLCGALAVIGQGRVVSASADIRAPAGSWATGSTAAWAQAMTGASNDHLKLGGDKLLASALLDGLRGVLFDTGRKPAPNAPS